MQLNTDRCTGTVYRVCTCSNADIFFRTRRRLTIQCGRCCGQWRMPLSTRMLAKPGEHPSTVTYPDANPLLTFTDLSSSSSQTTHLSCPNSPFLLPSFSQTSTSSSTSTSLTLASPNPSLPSALKNHTPLMLVKLAALFSLPLPLSSRGSSD